MKSPIAALAHVIRGFAMGAADIVPGVSGGTVALILGIYERLLESVRTGARALGALVKGDVAGFRRQFGAIEWLFIIPLLAGVGGAVIVLSGLLDRFLEEEPEAMAGLFFGLVAASIIVAWGLLRQRDTQKLVIASVVAVVAFFVLGFQAGPLVDPPLWSYFLAGSVAICAMILPGISGSFLLLMLGMYAPFIGAVHDRELLIIAVFGVGAIIGLALFSTLLSWVLERYRDELLAGLIGLMAGSLRVLWPWPNGVGIIGEEDEAISGVGIELPAEAGDWVVPTLLAVVAFVVVIVVTKLAPGEDGHTGDRVSAEAPSAV